MLQHAYQTQFVQNPAKNDLQSNSAAKSMKLEELYLNKKISFFRGRKEKEGRNYKNKRCKRGGVHHVDQINIFNFVSFKLISYRN